MDLKTPSGHSILFVNDSVKRLKSLIDGRRTVVITDTNVRRLYPDLLARESVIAVPPGEAAKTLRTIEKIYRKFLDLDMDRSSFVLGIGGGIVCDMAGFAASTFMRGLPFGFVPTTLLAQVDAAVGGKNGVNLDRYKNIVGVFRQPRFILIDFKFLETLPGREVRNGMAEIIKHALIASPSLFRYLEKERAGLPALRPKILETIVLQSVKIKAGIVRADEHEEGQRRKLNFGHTLGHAIERAGRFRHGEAVSIGMAMAVVLSVARGMLSPEDAKRITDLLDSVNLPVRIPLNAETILKAIRKDKKRCREDIHFVFLSGIGKAEVRKISTRELEAHVRDLCQHR